MEIFKLLGEMPGFGEVGYHFVKMFRCKEGSKPINGTVVTMFNSKKYILRWYPPNERTITLGCDVLNQWSLKNNGEVNDSIIYYESYYSSTSSKSITRIYSSNDSDDSENGGADSE